MTRHELKELEHDQLVAKVGDVIDYTSHHKPQVIRWVVIGVVALLLIAGGWWYFSYQKTQRQAAVRDAFLIAEATTGGKDVTPFVKNFPTQQAKEDAMQKAFSDIAVKYSGTREGDVGAFYAAVLKNDKGDSAAAEALLKGVIDGGRPMAAMARITLATLYAGEGKYTDAENLVKPLIDKPTDLVSKEHAQIVMAQVLAKHDPAAAKKLLASIKPSGSALERPALERAVDELRATLERQ